MLDSQDTPAGSTTRRKSNLIGARVDDEMAQQWKDTHLALIIELGAPDLTMQEVVITVVELLIRPDDNAVGQLAARIRERRRRLVAELVKD